MKNETGNLHPCICGKKFRANQQYPRHRVSAADEISVLFHGKQKNPHKSYKISVICVPFHLERESRVKSREGRMKNEE
jgi:hypothetical protein